jgi:hypothetical protein
MERLEIIIEEILCRIVYTIVKPISYVLRKLRFQDKALRQKTIDSEVMRSQILKQIENDKTKENITI